MAKRTLLQRFKRSGRLTRVEVVNVSGSNSYKVGDETRYFGYVDEDMPSQSIAISGDEGGGVTVFIRRTVQDLDAEIDITLMGSWDLTAGDADVSSPDLADEREDLAREYCYPALVPYFEAVAATTKGMLGQIRKFPALEDFAYFDDDIVDEDDADD